MNDCVKTTCPYCGVGCGVDVTVLDREQRRIQVKGDSSHPANFGRLCSKGSALHETVDLSRRCLEPKIRGRVVHWNEAIDAAADGLCSILERYGPEAVAIYGSGQLLTEDYYVANKLMKGYIGSANIDTNSRLCMSSAVVAQQRAFGEDLVPCEYADIEMADLVLMVGSNLAWCHPVIYQRLVAAKAARPQMKVVVLDPRSTASLDVADYHLPLKTNSDIAVFMGLLNHLVERNQVDRSFVDAYVEGFDQAAGSAARRFPDLNAVAELTGLSAESLSRFFELFAQTERIVTLFSQGVNQSAQATDAINAIINCHLATGRIGKPGMGPFSMTGQPNAMGGREVGGMASILAAHMDFAPVHVERLGRFWGVQQVAAEPGLKAVDLFDAIYDGKVKAVWILATNPAVSLPDSEKVRAALARCELVIVSEAIADTDTSAYATVLLPAATWGERDGTVTNSERRISRQRPLFALPGKAKPDWWALCEVAKRMGYDEGFNFANSYEIFCEYAALTGFENIPGSDSYRALNLSALNLVSRQDYDAFAPVQWPINGREVSESRSGTSVLLDRLAYSGRKACMVPVDVSAAETLAESQLLLNTGRLRDHWHTMSRTGLSPRLSSHVFGPFVAVNPLDAERFELSEGGFAEVVGDNGRSLLSVQVTSDQPQGQLFAPIHWSDVNSSGACISRSTHARVDGPSGQPDSKASKVSIRPVTFNSFSRWFLREDLDLAQFGLVRGRDYWVKNTFRGGYCYDIAMAIPGSVHDWVREVLRDIKSGEWLEHSSSEKGVYRACCLVGGELRLAVFVDQRRTQLPAYEDVQPLFAAPRASYTELSALVNIASAVRSCNAGGLCACAAVTRSRVESLLKSGEARTVEEVMSITAAGKNCGSCLPELKALTEKTLFSIKAPV